MVISMSIDKQLSSAPDNSKAKARRRKKSNLRTLIGEGGVTANLSLIQMSPIPPRIPWVQSFSLGRKRGHGRDPLEDSWPGNLGSFNAHTCLCTPGYSNVLGVSCWRPNTAVEFHRSDGEGKCPKWKRLFLQGEARRILADPPSATGPAHPRQKSQTNTNSFRSSNAKRPSSVSSKLGRLW